MSMLGQSRAYLQGLLKHLLRVLTAHLQHFFVGVHHAGQQVGRAMALVVQILTELLQPRVLRQLAFHQDSADSSRMYLWWSFITGRSCDKYHFCHDKHVFVMTNMCFVTTNMFVATKVWLLRQRFCHDKIMFFATNITSITFVMTNMCLSWQTCVLSRQTCLLWQKYGCCDKGFVTTKLCFSQQIFVTTNILSRQAYFCCDKSLCFVATNMYLLWQTYVCCNKTFVKTKILVGAPVNDRVYRPCVFICMRGKSYHRWLRSLLLYLYYIFQVLLTPLCVDSADNVTSLHHHWGIKNSFKKFHCLLQEIQIALPR